MGPCHWIFNFFFLHLTAVFFIYPKKQENYFLSSLVIPNVDPYIPQKIIAEYRNISYCWPCIVLPDSCQYTDQRSAKKNYNFF